MKLTTEAKITELSVAPYFEKDIIKVIWKLESQSKDWDCITTLYIPRENLPEISLKETYRITIERMTP